MDIPDIILDLLVADVDVELLPDLGPVGRALQNPVTGDHPIAEAILIDPGDFNVDKQLLKVPGVQRGQV